MNILYSAAAIVIASGIAYGAGYYNGKVAGKKEVQQLWDKQIAQQALDHAEAQEKARKKEQAMQASADVLRQEKDREIRNLNARATALANSLQQRADRNTQAGQGSTGSGNGQTGPRCTGAELSRQDAEFLAREAARADSLRALLVQCHAQYDAVRSNQ